MFRLICLSLLICSAAHCVEEISLDSLKHAKSEEQMVKIRGFLYRSETGRIILAKEPGLKTCCVGAPAQADRQVVVEGLQHIPKGPSYQVIALEGILYQVQDEYRLRIVHSGPH